MKKPVYSRCIAVKAPAAYKEILLIILFTLIMVLLGKQLSAQAYMQVSPTRLVFDGQERIQELNLTNRGKDTLRYDLTMIEMRMNETGKLEQVTSPDSGQFFASKFVTFFPSRVELAPGETQPVKVLLTRPIDMPEGEYRSHLHFAASGAPIAPATIDSAGVSLNLKPLRVINVPLIVRQGDANVRVAIADVGFTVRNDTPVCRVTVNRLGNVSVYGDLIVNFATKTGENLVVGELKGVAIYTPNLYRKFEVRLKSVPGLNYKEGKFTVEYKDANAASMVQKNFVLH